MSTFTTVALSALALSAGVNAHMTLHDPTPYSPKPDNSPVSSNSFPCKVGSGFSAATVTRATVGQPLQLSFDGSATHAGGSCQVSLSKDYASQLSPSSTFKVIYSIMGGCPNGKYAVNIPKEVPSGDYTLAWTWFNNIGNREMYMNCAPVSVSGGGSGADFGSLPDMAVFNIASKNDCRTTETKDVQFPHPGKYVEMSPGAKLAPPTGSCASGMASGETGEVSASPSRGGGGSSSGDSSGSSHGGSWGGSDGMYRGGSSGGSEDMYRGGSSGTPTGNSGGYISHSPSSSANNVMYTPSAEQSSAKKGHPTPAPSPSPANNGNRKIEQSGQACSTEGAVVCSADGTQFALCNFGNAKFMAVAPGTRCANGAIARRNIWRKE